MTDLDELLTDDGKRILDAVSRRSLIVGGLYQVVEYTTGSRKVVTAVDLLYDGDNSKVGTWMKGAIKNLDLPTETPFIASWVFSDVVAGARIRVFPSYWHHKKPTYAALRAQNKE